MRKKIAQIWIETVIYTLIGLALISFLLFFAKPKIEEIQDRAAIERTVDMLNELDLKIREVLDYPGNKRIVEFSLSRGKMTFNSAEDKIIWIFESSYRYSEQNKKINIGKVELFTLGEGPYIINSSISYNFNLTYNGKEEDIYLEASSSRYKISILNKGNNEIAISLL